MRTEVRTKEAKYNVYIADDGTEFESVFDCESYEENKYKKAYENLPCITFCLNDLYEDGGDYTYYKIFPIRNKEDIKIINTYLFREGEFDDFLTEEYIGKSAFICETDSTVWLADGYTIEAMKDEIVSNLDRFIIKVKAMEKEYLD